MCLTGPTRRVEPGWEVHKLCRGTNFHEAIMESWPFWTQVHHRKVGVLDC